MKWNSFTHFLKGGLCGLNVTIKVGKNFFFLTTGGTGEACTGYCGFNLSRSSLGRATPLFFFWLRRPTVFREFFFQSHPNDERNLPWYPSVETDRGSNFKPKKCHRTRQIVHLLLISRKYRLKAISYVSRLPPGHFRAELRSSHLPGCDWLAGLENTLNCRQCAGP